MKLPELLLPFLGQCLYVCLCVWGMGVGVGGGGWTLWGGMHGGVQLSPTAYSSAFTPL